MVTFKLVSFILMIVAAIFVFAATSSLMSNDFEDEAIRKGEIKALVVSVFLLMLIIFIRSLVL